MPHRGEPADFCRQWLDATRLDLSRLGGRRLDWHRRPVPEKHYPNARRIALPRPEPSFPTGGDGLWSALRARRSRRDYTDRPLPSETLALLLWAAQGVTARSGSQLLRTAPSAGALYPFETYVSVQRVDGLPPCLAHLHVPSFSLELLGEGEYGPHLAQAALGQRFVAAAAAVFVWTAVLPRCAWKYGDRAVRYLGLDLGHVCQNLLLAAEALGLASCPVAAFEDEEVNRILDVDGTDEFVYYLATVGVPAAAAAPANSRAG